MSVKGEFPVEKPVKKREKWKSKIDFVFGVAGGSIGLGNVWRFPYLCYKNGGGAFLIPYVLFLVGAAVPIFFLEAALGQFTSRSVSSAWNMFPLMRGIGFASMTIIMNLNTYYMAVLAWSLRYVVASFESPLPWTSCHNAWNTDRCFVYGSNISTSENSDLNMTSIQWNMTSLPPVVDTSSNETGFFNTSSAFNTSSNDVRVSSVIEYWERGVLGKSSGVDEIGSVQMPLFGCLLVAWLIIYFCIWRGIAWTSKVVYFTATFPLFMLLVLFIRGVTLDGASDGVSYYLTPNVTKLQEPLVWVDAATQVFYSYSLCNGIMVAMGSYNNYHQNLYRDTIVLSLLNSGTSFFAGFTVFSVLGFMAKEQNTTIDLVAESGPGLVFIAYPKAITLMPLPNLWGALFFLMIFLLGLDSQFIGQESFIAAISDLKPNLFNKPWRREKLVAGVCGVQFLIGIIMITQGGVYVFNMYDNYAAAGWCLFFIGVCECVTVSWLYGITDFWGHVCHMLGFKPRVPWFKYAWAVVAPVLTSSVFIYSLVQYEPLTYNRTYIYPMWAQVVCWCLALSAILWIPFYAVYRFAVAQGTMYERWIEVTTVPQKLEQRLETKKKIFGNVEEKNGIILEPLCLNHKV
ncbi:sodium- and chloride-dependent GABA transporter 2-like [Ciona intestinalis]